MSGCRRGDVFLTCRAVLRFLRASMIRHFRAIYPIVPIIRTKTSRELELNVNELDVWISSWMGECEKGFWQSRVPSEVRLPKVSRSRILECYMLLNLSAVVLHPDFWQAGVYGVALRVPILKLFHLLKAWSMKTDTDRRSFSELQGVIRQSQLDHERSTDAS